MILINKLRTIETSIIAFAILLCFTACSSCNRETDKEKDINGIVTDKYIDEFGHYTNVISLNGYNNIVLTPWEKGRNIDTGDIWDYIEVGDSVYKAQGNLKMKVIKPSGEYQVFDYYHESGW